MNDGYTDEELANEEPSFLANALRTSNSLRTKVGRTDKQRHIDIAAVIFLEVMRQHKGTFVWEGPKMGEKFANVFESLAASMPVFESKDWHGRHEHIEEYTPKLRSGFYSARRWLNEWYGNTVFAVPQQNESTMPTVITLDPNYMLEKSGKTAAEMQNLRDSKLAEGQLKAATLRVAGSNGKNAGIAWLDRVVEHARYELENFAPSRAIEPPLTYGQE